MVGARGCESVETGQLSFSMQFRFALALAASVTASGCALLGFGPPVAVVEGSVLLAEDMTPLGQAEVCAFGIDTTCVRADQRGRYRLRLTAQTIALRFRAGNLTPATSDTLRLVPPERYTLDCAISGRLVISDRPVPCQRPPAR
jgi:hypothetical protein